MSTTILVLEDDSVLQDLLREVLQDEGFQVIAATSLPELLEIVPQHARLLITDLLFNFETVGLTAIEQVRQVTQPNLPALICTAAQKHVEVLQPEIARLGAYVLTKPFTIDELVATINCALQPTAPPRTFSLVNALSVGF